jgi:hypothetical protein
LLTTPDKREPSPSQWLASQAYWFTATETLASVAFAGSLYASFFTGLPMPDFSLIKNEIFFEWAKALIIYVQVHLAAFN